MSRSGSKFDDIDLMQYVDGELEDEALSAEIARAIEIDEDVRAKVQAMAQIGEGTRTHLELVADEVEPRLDALWAHIERGIQANGAHAESAAVPAAVPRTERRPEAAKAGGLWAGIREWLDSYRGHFLTGAVAAGVAAAIILAVQPTREVTKQVIVERPVGSGMPTMDDGQGGSNVAAVNNERKNNDASQAGQVKLVNESSPPEIEHLEVNGGSGSVFVIPREGEDDVEATVIFVDMSDVEGPL